jgi:hypothetical protein
LFLLSLMMILQTIYLPFYEGKSYYPPPNEINPEDYTINVQVGEQREYNVSKMFPKTTPKWIFIEEGQNILVTVTNVTKGSVQYKVGTTFVNGSTFNVYNTTVYRGLEPKMGTTHYITTTNKTLLKQALDRRTFLIYEFKKQELVVQWVRNATIYPDLISDKGLNHIEEWNYDLKTGWLNYYQEKIVDNGTLKREISVEVIESNNQPFLSEWNLFLVIPLLICVVSLLRCSKRKL